MPKLPSLARDHSDVEVNLVVQDGLVDIMAERFDVGVRVAEGLERDMISVRISPPLQLVAAASPDYLAARGAPRELADLLAHRGLHYRYTTSGRIHRWRFADAEGAERVVDVPAALVSNDLGALHQAARAGLGIGMFTRPQVAEDLGSGRLLAVLEPWCPTLPPNHPLSKPTPHDRRAARLYRHSESVTTSHRHPHPLDYLRIDRPPCDPICLPNQRKSIHDGRSPRPGPCRSERALGPIGRIWAAGDGRGGRGGRRRRAPAGEWRATADE